MKLLEKLKMDLLKKFLVLSLTIQKQYVNHGRSEGRII